MALNGSYEAKLLRLLVGYSHVSVLQQAAILHHGKGYHLLTLEEQKKLENDVLGAVMHVAHQVSEEALLGKLNPPTVN